jgi:hypothetical protein
METEGACALIFIIGQWGVQCSTGAICQHEPNADKGIASKTTTSAEATNLKRHVMFLSRYYGGLSALAVTQITATCTHPKVSHARFGCLAGARCTRSALSEFRPRRGNHIHR